MGARVLVWHLSVMASTGAAPSQPPFAEEDEAGEDEDAEEADVGVVVFSTLRTSAVNARSVKFNGAPSESTDSSSSAVVVPLKMAVPPNSSPNVCLCRGEAPESDQTLTRSGCDRLTMWCSVSLSSRRVVVPN